MAGIGRGIEETAVTLDDILKELQTQRAEGEEEKAVIITYPHTGKKDLSTGLTVIDIPTMTVTLPDGAKEKIYPPIKVEELRSALIYLDSTSRIDFLREGTVTHTSDVFPTWIRYKDIVFDRLEITTTRPTIFFAEMSTVVDGVRSIEPATYYEGNPFVYRGAIAVADTYQEIDVRTSLGWNAHNGFIANMGNTGADLMILLYDGTDWTTEYYTIIAGGVENITHGDIAKIKLKSPTANTEFEINLR